MNSHSVSWLTSLVKTTLWATITCLWFQPAPRSGCYHLWWLGLPPQQFVPLDESQCAHLHENTTGDMQLWPLALPASTLITAVLQLQSNLLVRSIGIKVAFSITFCVESFFYMLYLFVNISSATVNKITIITVSSTIIKRHQYGRHKLTVRTTKYI